ncbi:hypothetical protein QYE76_011518 [Lolium multiflorum]|uniref:Uncharacterized protein n=1 Tax=Lolium multiflorum TaxID=4521 RepID=A0AAD8TVI0_LOLMU|nr:hypothetical protein QYE76_011518 [Lolium multiflorum]
MRRRLLGSAPSGASSALRLPPPARLRDGRRVLGSARRIASSARGGRRGYFVTAITACIVVVVVGGALPFAALRFSRHDAASPGPWSGRMSSKRCESGGWSVISDAMEVGTQGIL